MVLTNCTCGGNVISYSEHLAMACNVPYIDGRFAVSSEGSVSSFLVMSVAPEWHAVFLVRAAIILFPPRDVAT